MNRIVKRFGVQIRTLFTNGVRYRWDMRIGRLALHKFYRGDTDPDAHDHPADFWTFPLNTYIESTYEPATDRWSLNVVDSWCWHYRPATYCHRVLGRWVGDRTTLGHKIPIHNDLPFYTVVWWGKERRMWGFWYKNTWVPWKDYLNKDTNKLWVE